jgi:hypothetical protein
MIERQFDQPFKVAVYVLGGILYRCQDQNLGQCDSPGFVCDLTIRASI